MMRECIPILFKFNSRSPNHSFNLAPSMSYSGGAQINPVLGLCGNCFDKLPYSEMVLV